MKRCDYCIDETCKGKHNCNCKECKLFDKCFRILHPTIRITNKCTQECSHCCFCSSPKSTIFMSVDKAKEISEFLKVNEIPSVNLMGGEFFCNPDWYEVITALSENVLHTRLVTNGDWVNNKKVKEKLKSFIQSKDKTSLTIAVSKDQWHTNKNVSKAIEFLESLDCSFKVTTEEEDNDRVIVPVGRGRMTYNMYSFIACSCHNPKHKYSFLIDEEGDIYKCAFGVWKYTNVSDHLDGSFPAEFKRFNTTFYDLFVPSCKSCYRSATFSKVKMIVDY